MMNGYTSKRVLIVGAGSMGMVIGYHLSLAGVNVTFLVHPHHAEALEQPQALYCYNDNQLKTFSSYKYFTDPSQLVGTDYDYVFITLDGASLRNEVGQALVKTIGNAVRGTETSVIVGAVFLEMMPWFLEKSGLPAKQVITGAMYIHAYPVKRFQMPQSPQMSAELISKADVAYTDVLGPGIIVDDSSPAVANGFAALYNACGVSRCDVTKWDPSALFGIPLFAIFAASDLMDWPRFRDIDPHGQQWSLGIAAAREIQGLGIFGEAGQVAAQSTTEEGSLAMLAGVENAVLPLEMQTFNRLHHGGKVNLQDTQILNACLTSGKAEGKPMAALTELLQKVESHRANAPS